jgi:hypothetical protein
MASSGDATFPSGRMTFPSVICTADVSDQKRFHMQSFFSDDLTGRFDEIPV